jgi:hypothetical protein
MNTEFCRCGVRLRRWFNDIFSCPRCQKIFVFKDGVTMTWSGSIATLLLDQIEKFVTQELLNHRHLIDEMAGPTVEDDKEEIPKFVEAGVYRRALISAGKKVTECINCHFPVEDRCGAQCPACKTLQPCGIDGQH